MTRDRGKMEVLSFKCVAVGDDEGNVKTQVLTSLLRCAAAVNEDGYIPTVFDNTEIRVRDGKDRAILELWDTTGQVECVWSLLIHWHFRYEKLRPLSYPNTQIFILTFSFGNPASLKNITELWYKEAKFHCPEAKVCLVGIESPNPQVTVDEAILVSKDIQACFFCTCDPVSLHSRHKSLHPAHRIQHHFSEAATHSPCSPKKFGTISRYIFLQLFIELSKDLLEVTVQSATNLIVCHPSPLDPLILQAFSAFSCIVLFYFRPVSNLSQNVEHRGHFSDPYVTIKCGDALEKTKV